MLEIMSDETAGIPHLLTAMQVAKILGKSSAKRVYPLPIPQTRPTPGCVMYHPDDVRAYIESHREGSK